MDHVHECPERRFACIDQAEAKKIEMNGAQDVTVSKLLRRSHVDQAEIRGTEFLSVTQPVL